MEVSSSDPAAVSPRSAASATPPRSSHSCLSFVIPVAIGTAVVCSLAVLLAYAVVEATPVHSPPSAPPPLTQTSGYSSFATVTSTSTSNRRGLQSQAAVSSSYGTFDPTELYDTSCAGDTFEYCSDSADPCLRALVFDEAPIVVDGNNVTYDADSWYTAIGETPLPLPSKDADITEGRPNITYDTNTVFAYSIPALVWYDRPVQQMCDVLANYESLGSLLDAGHVTGLTLAASLDVSALNQSDMRVEVVPVLSNATMGEKVSIANVRAGSFEVNTSLIVPSYVCLIQMHWWQDGNATFLYASNVIAAYCP